ncbi:MULTISPECIES: hypothetical protein, partial [Bacteroidales]
IDCAVHCLKMFELLFFSLENKTTKHSIGCHRLMIEISAKDNKQVTKMDFICRKQSGGQKGMERKDKGMVVNQWIWLTAISF